MTTTDVRDEFEMLLEESFAKSNTVADIVEGTVIKKHLGCKEFTARILLNFKRTDVGFYVGTFRMFFRIAGTSNAKIPVFPDKIHKLMGMLKFPLCRISTFRNIITSDPSLNFYKPPISDFTV